MAEQAITNHLAPALRARFEREILKSYSVTEVWRLSCLPVPQIRQEIATKVRALGTPLTRHECDGILQDLALVLPRAGLGADEIDRMLDLYFGLLREIGVTKPMLARAAKDFVMTPRKGKPKFFPDPGELAEQCRADAFERQHALEALSRAQGVLDGKVAPPAADGFAPDISARLRALSDKMRTGETV